LAKTRTSLPERTVDAWVVAYLATEFPHLILWAPTQRSTPDLDFLVKPTVRGKLFILEDKASYIDPAIGMHVWPIGVRQLFNYVQAPLTRERCFYVLPSPPYKTADVDRALLLPELATARLRGNRWSGLPFESWTYVISALDLWSILFGPPMPQGGPLPKSGPVPPRHNPPPPPEETIILQTDLAPRGKLAAHTQTLASFVDDLKTCRREDLRIEPGRPLLRVTDAEHYMPNDIAGPVELSANALVAIAPSGDLPGWNDGPE
jgi:hypothetical protein